MRRLPEFFSRMRGAPALALALGLPVLLFYLPLLVGARTFEAGDLTQHFLPFALFQAESLRALHLPLWNPHTFAGHPFLADTQAAVFYPPSNLLLALTLPLTDPAARLYVLQIEAVLHTLLAGWFVALLVRELTGERWAAALAGITFALSGYLTGYPPLQVAVLRTAVWLPLVLWLLLKARRAIAAGRRPWGWALGAGLALATAFLAGHPQTFLYIAYATAGWVLLLMVDAFGSRPGPVIRLTAAALLAALSALALVMVQLLPSLEYTGLSVRAAADYAFAAGGFPLRDTWQMLLPGILTRYSPLYVGLPALVLGAAALLPRRESAGGPVVRGAGGFFAGMALLALLVSFGGNGPIFALVWRVLPGFGAFRGQERAAFLVALALSVLAGLGAARLPHLPARTRKRLALAAGAALIAAVYAAGLLLQLPGRSAVDNGTFLLTAVVALVLAAATALVIWLPVDGRLAPRLLALTVVGLFAASFGGNFSRATLGAQVALPPEAVALAEAVAHEPGAAQGLPGRVFNEFRVWEDYSMLAGVEDLWGASPLRLAGYAALQADFPLDRWWSLTGVSHVLTWRRDLFVPAVLQGEWPQPTDTTWLHALESPGARAWVVSGVRVATDDEAVALLADHTLPLASTAVLPPEAGIAAHEPVSPARPARVRLTRLNPETLRVEVESGGGLLVVSENWMPGWRVDAIAGDRGATVMGVPAFALVRANLSFLGVTVPQGEAAFTLRYAPASVATGLWVSGGALILVLLGFVLLGATARRGRP